MIDPRLQKMASVIIHYSTAVQPGDQVLIRSQTPAAEPLVQALYQGVLAAGASAFPYIHLRHEDTLAMDATQDLGLLAEPNPMLMQMYAQADVVIGIHAAENMRELSAYPADLQAARAQARAAPLRIQRQRQAAGTIRRCTTQFPTEAYAQAAGMSLAQYSTFLFGACKLHLDDPVGAWQDLRARQDRLVQWLAGKRHLHVRGKSIDLQMAIEGRRFVNSAGTANFPDGEIFTGPVEDSVEGWVRFSYPAIYEGIAVQGVKLHFEAGQVVKASAETNAPFLQQMLDTDAGSRYVGEFGIGTNTDIQQFTGAILFDEKIGGTVHIALGQGYGETGSQNDSQIHWDMVCDLRDGGEILVDGERFYANGRFIVE